MGKLLVYNNTKTVFLPYFVFLDLSNSLKKRKNLAISSLFTLLLWPYVLRSSIFNLSLNSKERSGILPINAF